MSLGVQNLCAISVANKNVYKTGEIAQCALVEGAILEQSRHGLAIAPLKR